MRLSADRIKRFCARRGVSLQAFLDSAGVSRTAYYSLIRKNSILPRPVPNPTGYNAGSGGTPGDSSHGSGPLGRNGTPSAGGMRVGSQ